MSAIQPLVLLWSGLELTSLRLRTLGGGVTHGSYPPSAYREREVVLRSSISDPFIIESAPDGRSSNRDLPFLQLHAEGGGVISALEWSGPWYQEVRAHPTGAMLWAGVPGDELVLAPGETLALPAVHLIGYSRRRDRRGKFLSPLPLRCRVPWHRREAGDADALV